MTRPAELGDSVVPKPLFVILLIAVPIAVMAASGSFLLGVFSLLVILIANPIVRAIRKARYFGSEHFRLQVVRNASAEPIKYLIEYFSVRADQETLADVQRVAGDISRLEEAVGNVRGREADLMARISPPAFIQKHYAKEFWDQIGAHLSPISVPYPQYKFQYTSAGGNSAQMTRIQLNTPTLEALGAAAGLVSS